MTRAPLRLRPTGGAAFVRARGRRQYACGLFRACPPTRSGPCADSVACRVWHDFAPACRAGGSRTHPSRVRSAHAFPMPAHSAAAPDAWRMAFQPRGPGGAQRPLAQRRPQASRVWLCQNRYCATAVTRLTAVAQARGNPATVRVAGIASGPGRDGPLCAGASCHRRLWAPPRPHPGGRVSQGQSPVHGRWPGRNAHLWAFVRLAQTGPVNERNSLTSASSSFAAAVNEPNSLTSASV